MVRNPLVLNTLADASVSGGGHICASGDVCWMGGGNFSCGIFGLIAHTLPSCTSGDVFWARRGHCPFCSFGLISQRFPARPSDDVCWTRCANYPVSSFGLVAQRLLTSPRGHVCWPRDGDGPYSSFGLAIRRPTCNPCTDRRAGVDSSRCRLHDTARRDQLSPPPPALLQLFLEVVQLGVGLIHEVVHKLLVLGEHVQYVNRGGRRTRGDEPRRLSRRKRHRVKRLLRQVVGARKLSGPPGNHRCSHHRCVCLKARCGCRYRRLGSAALESAAHSTLPRGPRHPRTRGGGWTARGNLGTRQRRRVRRRDSRGGIPRTFSAHTMAAATASSG